MKQLIFSLIILTFFFSSSLLADKKMSVVFLNVSDKNDMFWNYATSHLENAAKEFNIDLKVYYSHRSRKVIIEQTKEAVLLKPDFLLFAGSKEATPEILAIAEQAGVKTLIFDNSLDEAERIKYGFPREKFKTWLGELMPDNDDAGYRLAKVLVGEARKRNFYNKNGKIEIAAITGLRTDTAAKERNKGFMRYMKECNDVVLHRDFLPGNWTSNEAGNVFSLFYRVYPDTKVVWNANDAMAMGVINALEKNFQKTPGKDLIIGGIDWNPENIEAVKSGKLFATIGGHTVEGGWAIVMVYDYFNGIDFASEKKSFYHPMGTITVYNIGSFYNRVKNNGIGSIRWSDYSIKNNKKTTKYDFDVNKIFKQENR